MQINRLFEMVYLLLDKKQMTVGALAAHFEVSRRTILRDIETLSQAGIPIYTAQGRGGGVFILDRFVLNKTTISEEEQNQILLALQSLSSAQLIDAGGTLSRLGALFRKQDTGWIEVDFSRWGNMDRDKEKFDGLKSAVIEKKAISFGYAGASGQNSARTVYPLKLVFKSRAWYVQAYCLEKEDYRTFKINRMSAIRTLPDSFAGQEFSPPPIDGEYGGAIPLVPLKLRFPPGMAYRVYDEFDEEEIAKNADASFTVTVTLPDGPWLYGFLLSFGTDVRVLEPPYVLAELSARAEKIKKLYSEPKR